jgi:naphthalene 1,2-dioxygenase system ferredoxin subunit
MSTETRVAALSDLPVGKMQLVEVDGRELLLCRSGDQVHALDNLCTHAEARLCEGKFKGGKVYCPLHGAAFDVITGEAMSRPATVALDTFVVVIRGGDIFLKMDEVD